MKIELELKDLAEVLDHSLEDDVWDNRECVTSDSIKEALRDIILKDVAEKLCDSSFMTRLSSSLLQNNEFKEKVADKLANIIADRFEKKKAVQDVLPKINQTEINKDWEDYFDKRISFCISKKFK